MVDRVQIDARIIGLENELREARADFQQRTTIIDQQLAMLRVELEKSSEDDATEMIPLSQESTVMEESDLGADVISGVTSSQSHKPPSNNPWIGKTETAHKPSQLLAWLKSRFITVMIGPLASLTGYGLSLYRHYKELDKLPVFFMTLFGIFAMVIGAGYLLQYSLAYLSPLTRVGLSYVVSIGVVALGVWLHRHRTGFEEYASSLAGLGVILLYLSTFFAAASYQILPAQIAVAALLVITMGAYLLAMHLQARVVAIIALVGGALAPFTLGTESGSAVGYLSYLLLLVVAALYTSRRIQWKIFSTFSILFGAALFEFVAFQAGWLVRLLDYQKLTVGPESYPAILLVYLFCALFFFQSLFDGLQLRQYYRKSELGLIGGGVALLLGNLYAVSPPDLTAWLYSGTALIFMLPLLYPGEGRTKQLPILVGISASLLGFAIAFTFSPAYEGFVWGFEALLLIYLGLHTHQIVIRYEGYLVMAVALYHSASEALLLDFSAGGVLSASFANIGVLFLVTLSMEQMVRFYVDRLSDWETMWLPRLHNTVSVTGLMVWLGAVYLLIPQFWLGLSGISMIFLLWRGERLNLLFTQIVGLFCYGLVLAEAGISVAAVESLSFTEQTLAGKAAYIESFYLLWALLSLVKRFNPASLLMGLADKTRILAYLLMPVLIMPPLPTVMRRAPELFSYALLVSLIVCLILAAWQHRKVLRQEAWVIGFMTLVVALSLGFIAATSGGGSRSLDGLMMMSLSIVIMFGIVVWATYWVRAGKQLDPVFFPYLIWLPLFLAGVIFNTTLMVFTGLVVALSMTGLYCLGVATLARWYLPAESTLKYYVQGAMWLAILSIVILLGDAWRATVASLGMVFVLVAALYLTHFSNHPQIELIFRVRKKSRTWTWLTLLTMGSYLSIAEWMTGIIDGPVSTILLATHAIALLLYGIKNQGVIVTKIATILFAITAGKLLFYDMSGFSMLEKVIAFMVVGGVMLVGAYQYQRLSGRVIATKPAVNG